MVIRTKESLSGFVASDPELTFTGKGDARLYLRVGQPQVKLQEDGTFTQLDPTFTDLVMFRKSAERAHDQFRKGDNFIAEGETRTYTGQDGTEREQFVASRIGHDKNLTRYTVDRTPPQRDAAKRETPARKETSREPASWETAQQAVAAREAALEPDPEPFASTTSVQRDAVTR
ncbi:single-stranded DNA-binding protein [Microbacterium sp. NPDC077663]|uniref:single-stranded DNA-binding protein n=1 Tax=Microbacterium sp. NPDC077663 TaxID=3364189 RepID=UPI0037CA9F29